MDYYITARHPDSGHGIQTSKYKLRAINELLCVLFYNIEARETPLCWTAVVQNFWSSLDI